MAHPNQAVQAESRPNKRSAVPDRLLLGGSIILQILLAYFFGHAYDMRIIMSTGYLVGTGQNPYVAQDLSAVFHNSTFQGITTLGYPPPWSLVLGLIYLCTYKLIPNFLLYNLATKLPIVAANICLAYLVVHILKKLGVREALTHRAWLFLLFNPFLLLTSSAWGQFDPIMAVLVLLSLYLLSEGQLTGPAIMVALAISLKPTSIPLVPVIFIYLAGRSLKSTLHYFLVFSLAMVLFCVVPFFIFRWDPSPILQHWNNQFTVGGGLSFMTFLEYVKGTYLLPGQLWFLGWLWMPALGIASLAMLPGIKDFKDLLKKSLALVMVFYLSRSWLSETNLNLILPIVLILTCTGEFDRRTLTAFWLIPLVFSFFNTSIAQLFFPSMSGWMDSFLKLFVEYSTIRYAMRTLMVLVWLVAGWWIVWLCFKRALPIPVNSRPEINFVKAD
jgi:hypothetical protein